MLSRGNYDKHSNKRKSVVSEQRILITKKLTYACIVYHSSRRVALASMNMSVFKTRFLMKPLITLFFAVVHVHLPTFKLPVQPT